MIRFRLVFLALVAGLAGFAGLATGADAQAREPTVLVLGDSLSAAHGMPEAAGWVALLAARAAGRAQVVNASISGETTAGGLSRLPDLLAAHRPALVAIQLGANDGLRGLPITQIRDNLDRLAHLVRESGAQVLLLGIELPVNYGPRYRDQLRQVYDGLAQELDTGLVPFMLEGVALDPLLIQDDGLHPNAAAQPAILDNVWTVMAPMLD
ncbi:MAG: arylesterase [Xanthomonadales bacterium]|nr:arylesterase [Xanthomonadales bacterium]